jgi:hypothetical protein
VALGPVESGAISKERLDQILADEQRQKLLQDRRLVVPSERACRRFEYLIFGDAFAAAPID